MNLVDDDLANHAGTLVWLAVVAVFTSSVELDGVLLAWSVEVVLVGEGLSVDTRWDGILVEDNVVWETSVVHPSDAVTLGDGDGRWVENEGTCKNRSRKGGKTQMR